jgi:hypothetical protein
MLNGLYPERRHVAKLAYLRVNLETRGKFHQPTRSVSSYLVETAAMQHPTQGEQ